jgi:hypothetical protein
MNRNCPRRGTRIRAPSVAVVAVSPQGRIERVAARKIVSWEGAVLGCICGADIVG